MRKILTKRHAAAAAIVGVVATAGVAVGGAVVSADDPTRTASCSPAPPVSTTDAGDQAITVECHVPAVPPVTVTATATVTVEPTPEPTPDPTPTPTEEPTTPEPTPTEEPTPTPDPEPAGEYPPIFGAATTNNQADFEKLNTAWGPIRMTREYDSGGGFKPVDQYSWYNFSRQFDYIAFSADEQKSTASYRDVANGVHDAKIRAMVDSVRLRLAGKQGVILLGNEPNTENVDPTTYRAALEHVIDEFGYEPAPGFMWGVAFSNFNVWGQGSNAGRAWLPRRDAGPFMVETHFYGRDDYGDPALALGRTFLPAVEEHPTWEWGIGEMSAQEDPAGLPNQKADWFTKVGNYVQANDGAYMLPFDTNVGGSADVATSEPTRQAVKAIATRWQNNDWS